MPRRLPCVRLTSCPFVSLGSAFQASRRSRISHHRRPDNYIVIAHVMKISCHAYVGALTTISPKMASRRPITGRLAGVPPTSRAGSPTHYDLPAWWGVTRFHCSRRLMADAEHESFKPVIPDVIAVDLLMPGPRPGFASPLGDARYRAAISRRDTALMISP